MTRPARKIERSRNRCRKMTPWILLRSTAPPGKTIAERPGGSSGSPETLADSSRTIERTDRESGDVETIAGSIGALPPADDDQSQRTGVYTALLRLASGSHQSGDTNLATLPELAAVPHSDMTTDFGGEVASAFEKTSPDPPSGAAAGAPSEPPDYEILGELGRGGMGVVYKARHRRLNRLVALKMIRGAYVDEIQIARFKIEAEAVAALRHPNILQIYDIGEHNGSSVRGSRAAGRGKPDRSPDGEGAAAQAGGRMDGPSGDGNERGPSGRHPAPRPQVRQYPLQRRRHPQDHRLRPGQEARGGRGPDPHWPSHGNAELHGARASPGRYEAGRPPGRYLCTRGDALRDAHRPPAVQGRLGDGYR